MVNISFVTILYQRLHFDLFWYEILEISFLGSLETRFPDFMLQDEI